MTLLQPECYCREICSDEILITFHISDPMLLFSSILTCTFVVKLFVSCGCAEFPPLLNDTLPVNQDSSVIPSIPSSFSSLSPESSESNPTKSSSVASSDFTSSSSSSSTSSEPFVNDTAGDSSTSSSRTPSSELFSSTIITSLEPFVDSSSSTSGSEHSVNNYTRSSTTTSHEPSANSSTSSSANITGHISSISSQSTELPNVSTVYIPLESASPSSESLSSAQQPLQSSTVSAPSTVKSAPEQSQQLLASSTSPPLSPAEEWQRLLHLLPPDTPGVTTLKIGYMANIQTVSKKTMKLGRRLGAYTSGALLHAVRNINCRANRDKLKWSCNDTQPASSSTTPSAAVTTPTAASSNSSSTSPVAQALYDAPLPPGYQLDFLVHDTFDTELLSMQGITNMTQKQEVDVIIGLEQTCFHEADIASAFNTLIISPFCPDDRVSHASHSTFIRSKAQTMEMTYPLLALLKHFQWDTVTFVYNVNPRFAMLSRITEETLENCHITLRHKKAYDYRFSFSGVRNVFMDIVQETFVDTTVYVVIGEFSLTRGLVANLYKRGLLSTGELFKHTFQSTGRYFVVGLSQETPIVENQRATMFPMMFPEKTVPSYMYRYYIHLCQLQSNTSENIIFLTENIHLLQAKPFNVSRTERITGQKNIYPLEAGYLYDSVFLYATAVGNMIKRNQTENLRSGRALAASLINTTYRSSLGYKSRINSIGNAIGQFAVFIVEEVVIQKPFKFKFKLLQFANITLQPHKKYDNYEENNDADHCVEVTSRFVMKFLPGMEKWLNIPKLQAPVCGSRRNPCPPSHIQIILPLSGVGLLSLIIVAVVFIARNEVHKRALDRLIWKISKDELFVITESGTHEGGESLEGLETLAAHSSHAIFPRNFVETSTTEDIHHEGVNRLKPPAGIRHHTVGSYAAMRTSIVSHGGLSFFGTCLGMYRKNRVILKGIHKTNISVNDKMKHDLKALIDLCHPNLSKFHGACVDFGAICAVWEYSARGSLCTMFQEHSVLNENIFRISFIADILRGLAFLHSSEIGYHGNLKPSNCVIDSRWQLKLIDFGLQSLKSGESVSHLTEEEYFFGMLYTAPELLRHMLTRARAKAITGGQGGNVYLTSLSEELSSATGNSSQLVFSSTHASNAVLHMRRPRIFFASCRDWQRADVYALGLVLFGIFYRKQPFSYKTYSSREIIRRIVVLNDQFKVPYRPDLGYLSTTDKNMTDCIKMCWNESPAERLTVRQVLENLKPFLQPDGKEVDMLDNLSQILELYTKDLEALVARRAKEVELEQKRSVELLYEMLPAPVADQLRAGGQVVPEQFDAVTIYFSDLVGFQDVCRTQTPFQVVHILQVVYSNLDKIISTFPVYKVETVGEHYMVACGLPQPNAEHASIIANMALKVLREIRTSRILGSFPDMNVSLKPRIGIHSGPCMGGVIGKRMPRYCLFGDTVNTASRMESTGEAGKIQCSEATYLELARTGGYILQSRGLTQVKGKGKVQTYWLLTSVNEISETPSSPTLGNGPRSPTASLLVP